ncbi:TorF family putative porin [uncultured Albimonas sp.]|uniref:TorF family putative porin n=1 Tax=uncultured Albimonas sp. TaxID=1331701 RepID=UPI0030ECAFFF
MPRRAPPRLALILVAGLAAAPAAAQEDAPTLDLGVGFTSNYLFRGVTQSDDKPAVQPWAELGWRGVYGSVSASNVDFGTRAVEIDLAAGYRFALGPVDWELRAARFFYTDTGDCCGELVIKGYASPLERLRLGAEFHYDRGDADRYGMLAASVSLGDGFYVSGVAGAYLEDDGDADWNLGVGRAFEGGVAADLRVHDTTAGDLRVNATLSFATDWESLRGR